MSEPNPLSSAPSSSPSSFTLFSWLPAELRLEIWRLTCHPRVVEVLYDVESDQCLSSTPPPAVLHVCRESRLEALRVYRPSFGTRSREPRIYFCPDRDTLYLPRPPLMGYDDAARSFADLVPGAGDAVVNLAIDYIRPAVRRPWETYNKYALMQSFPRVQEVDLVLSTDGIANADADPSLPDRSAGASDDVKYDGAHGDLDLADPVGDVLDLCRLLTNIKESFFYEVGSDYMLGDPKEEFYERPVLPPIVLKSKVVSPHRDHRAAIGACV
ncbi:hypothetical protein GGS23DRAFT_546507 [Durotheca rogersii]|uniref:uncharacterized protein n=1 Tax=Durotheca rogersii TaxID=419775 RepID=UPI00221E6CCD|nr:uncharacterized protein GGS23DRAFT_546507 [Durotheca rogersii]KAI5868643.1 hypothetical protein GGS23DRAFT_546507 [Durotheca rogersii]